MFSSNDYNSFHYIMPGEDHQNPNLMPEEEHQSPYLHFQVPFLDDDDGGMLMSQLFSSNPPISDSIINEPPILNTTTPPTKKVKAAASSKKRSGGARVAAAVPRKRTGKTDRHSKIYTSKGPRDRRMRLSLQIARKFFHLQDMLGFDKASKTIEWLFTKSKAAIQELTDNLARIKEGCNNNSAGNGITVPSISEGEILSVAKEIEDKEQKKERKSSTLKASSSINVFVPKESREKARARARERTREKMKMMMKFDHGQKHHHMVDSIPEQEMDDSMMSTIEKFMGITSTDGASYCEEENYDPVFIDKVQMQYSYCAMANCVKELSGNVIQVQNPSSIFMEEQNPSSSNSTVFLKPLDVCEGIRPNSIQVSNSIFIQENEFCINNDVNYQQIL